MKYADTVMMKLTVLSVAALSAGIVGAETLGFWDFRDGNAGEDVTTVSNASGIKSYTSATAAKTDGTTGVLPKFNSDSPGELRAYEGGPILCANPQSIDFRYVSRSQRQGGYIDFDGVADDINGKGDFTIEYFVKQNADYSYYETGDSTWDQISKTMFYLEGRKDYGGLKQIMPTVANTTTKHANGVSVEVYTRGTTGKSASMSSVDLCDGRWHHVAIVYKETNSIEKAGQLTFYWDREKVSDFAYISDPEDATGLKFRMGTGYKNQGKTDKTTTEPVNASVSGLRVSNEALTIEQFLWHFDYYVEEDGTIALLTFTNATTGASAASVSYDASDLAILNANPGAGIAIKGIDDGCVPIYNDDVPGRYIFSSGSCETVLAENYKSLKYTSMGEATNSIAKQYDGVGGGCINFPLLGTALSYQKSYTIELFAKDEDWSEWQWESGLFYFNSKTNNTEFHNQCNVSSVKAGSVNHYVNMQGLSKAQKSTTWKDGKWHHVALVYDGEAGTQTIYLDYVAGTTVAYSNEYAASQRFVLGCRDNNRNYPWHGKIAGVRIVPRALKIGDFMVADDYKRPSGFVFSVNFDEGKGKDGRAFVTGVEKAASVQAVVTSGGGTEPLYVSYGLHPAAYPQFAEGSDVRAGRQVKWGETNVYENLAGCHFLGYGSLPSGTEYRDYAGTELCVRGSEDPVRNPTSWTMEAFVRPEYDNVNNTLLFAKAALANQHASPTPYPRYCWMLTREKDGKLTLYWTEQAEDPEYKYTDSSTDYYRSVQTTTGVLKDHHWYHVALSYDKPTKSFKLYVNYGLVLTQATSGLELFESTHDYYFSRIAASLGFEGWMDEIRYSNSALEPAQFISFESLGMLLLMK